MDQLTQFALDTMREYGFEYANGYIRIAYSDGNHSLWTMCLADMRKISIQKISARQSDGEHVPALRVCLKFSDDWSVWTGPIRPSCFDEAKALAQSILRMRDESLGFNLEVMYSIPYEEATANPPPTVSW